MLNLQPVPMISNERAAGGETDGLQSPLAMPATFILKLIGWIVARTGNVNLAIIRALVVSGTA